MPKGTEQRARDLVVDYREEGIIDDSTADELLQRIKNDEIKKALQQLVYDDGMR